MATFVLVPGGWSGGWAWKWVTPFIRAAGHEVAAITLTGLGNRAHLAHRDVGLDTYIEDSDWRGCEQVDLRSCFISRLAGRKSPLKSGLGLGPKRAASVALVANSDDMARA
jgi:hypothetical protein